MSELESSISEWRESLKAAFGDSDEIVDELESHLREEINRLMLTGQTPEAAFSAAQTKLGKPADLAAEYARAAAPAIWLPISIGLPLTILLFGLLILSPLANAIAMRPIGEAVPFFSGCVFLAIISYTTFLGSCYVVSRLIRPMSLGQLQSLRRSLIAGNTATALLITLRTLWIIPGMGQVQVFSILLLPLFPLCLTVMLTGLFWFNPKRLHQWMLLSIITLPVMLWAEIGILLIFEPWLTKGFSWIYSAACILATVSVSVVLLGMLPGRRVRRSSVLIQ
jgi:hypothetical protein